MRRALRAGARGRGGAVACEGLSLLFHMRYAVYVSDECSYEELVQVVDAERDDKLADLYNDLSNAHSGAEWLRPMRLGRYAGGSPWPRAHARAWMPARRADPVA
jgi:hypothetical protein